MNANRELPPWRQPDGAFRGDTPGMWFLASFRYLIPPTFIGVAPVAATVLVYCAFRDIDPQIGDFSLSPLGVAILSGLLLQCVGNWPVKPWRAADSGVRMWVIAVLLVVLFFATWGVFAAQETSIQIGWIVGYLLYTLFFTLMVFVFPPDNPEDIPSRWATDPAALRLTVVGYAVVAAGASTLMKYGSVLDWVLFVSVGRLVLKYFFDWIIILMIMTAPDQDP